MVAANDNTIEQPIETNSEVPTAEEGSDEEVELTKEQMMAAIPNLMTEGQRAYVLNDLETSAEKFSIATEYSVSVYGDIFSPECFEPHFNYGRALTGLAALESENPQVEFNTVREYFTKMAEERIEKLQGAKPKLDDSRIGNPDEITGEERDEIVAAVDEALEENAQELDQIGEKSEETMEEVVEAEATADKEKPDEAVTKEKTPEATEDAESEGDADENSMNVTQDVTMEDEQDDDDDEEDENQAKIAWEVLEIARNICEKQGESKEWDLKKAKVLSVLAELSLTEDKFENAINDLKNALEINQKYLDSNDRIIASSFYELGVAYRNMNDYLTAAEFMSKSKAILIACYEKVKAAGDTEESKDLEECVKDVTTALEDCQSSYKDDQRKKALEEKEVKQISPEKPKENQEPIADITSNIRKGKRPAEDTPEEAKKAKVEEEAVTPTVETIPADPVV
jgi:tetratricopeptide (TPR) repeat protein